MRAKAKVAVTPAERWPADKVERRPVSMLIANAHNSRKHSDEHVRQIARSIEQWGFTIPVLVDEGGQIIAGHARVLAAQRLKLPEVPVMVAVGWTAEQKRAYLIADNKLTENGDWNRDLLFAELEQLRNSNFDIGLTGFTNDDLDQALAKAAEAVEGEDPEHAPERPEVPITRRGDLWILGAHRVLCGDSTNRADVAILLGGAVPNVMVTDPPYGVDYDPAWRARAKVNLNSGKLGKVQNDDRADWQEAWALFPGAVAYVWHAGRRASEVQESLTAAGFETVSQIIWAKDRLVLSRGDYHWQHEPCWYCVREGNQHQWHGDRSQTTLWAIPAREDSGHGHGTQKPVECMLRPILNNSVAGDGVYDPFVGSGTTVIAAQQSGRHAYAMEIDPGYVDVVARRWQEFTGLAAVLQGDGRSFAEVAAERAAKSSEKPRETAPKAATTAENREKSQEIAV